MVRMAKPFAARVWYGQPWISWVGRADMYNDFVVPGEDGKLV